MSNPNLEGLEKMENFDDLRVNIRLTLRLYYGNFDGDQLDNLKKKLVRKWVRNELILEDPNNKQKLETKKYKKMLKDETVIVHEQMSKEAKKLRLGLYNPVRQEKTEMIKQYLEKKYPGRVNLKGTSKTVLDDKEVDEKRKELLLRTSMIALKEMMNIELNWAEKEYQEHLKTRATGQNIQQHLADEQAKRMWDKKFKKFQERQVTKGLKREVVKIKF